MSRADVIQNVNVYIIENNSVTVGVGRAIVKDVAKDHTCFGGRNLSSVPDISTTTLPLYRPSPNTHLDSRFDTLERVRSERMSCRSLDKLEIAQRRKLDRQVLQSLARLVDNQHVKEDIELMHVDVSLGIHRVREPSQLNDSIQFRNEIVLGGFSRSSRSRQIQLVFVCVPTSILL